MKIKPDIKKRILEDLEELRYAIIELDSSMRNTVKTFMILEWKIIEYLTKSKL